MYMPTNVSKCELKVFFNLCVQHNPHLHGTKIFTEIKSGFLYLKLQSIFSFALKLSCINWKIGLKM